MSSKPVPVARAGVKSVSVVTASCDYTAQNPQELSFQQGDNLIVLQVTDQFWKCKIGQQEGNVPCYLFDKDTAVENALHDACKRGNIAFLNDLLDQGISVNGLDKAGNTPLHWAARSKHTQVVEILLRKSPLINAQNKMGDTPMHLACWGGAIDVVKMIAVAPGVNLDLKNKNNERPIDLAKSDEIAAFLKQYMGEKTNVMDLEDEGDE